MLLGKIVGTVVATQKEPEIEGLRLMMVRVLNSSLEPSDALIIAADAIGSGVGEVVLLAQGSSARQTAVTDNRPIDAVVMAIVDLLEVGGETLYQKE